MHPSREFLPRDFFDLPADHDDAAIVGRGPNVSLRDRAVLLAERRLRQPVGVGQPNEPDDVAQVETLVRSTGDLDFRSGREPTGLFSAPLRDAIRGFQRRSNLVVDGIVNPNGATVQAIADETIQSLTAQIDSLREQIRQLGGDTEELSHGNDELNAQKDRLSAEQHVLQEALEGAGLSALGAVARGAPPLAVAGEAAVGGAQAALEELRRVQTHIEEINRQIQQNVNEIRFKTDFVQRLQADVSALIRERARLRGR